MRKTSPSARGHRQPAPVYHSPYANDGSDSDSYETQQDEALREATSIAVSLLQSNEDAVRLEIAEAVRHTGISALAPGTAVTILLDQDRTVTVSVQQPR